MPIPNFQQCMRPVLAAISDGQVHKFSDVYEAVCNYFSVTPEEKAERVSSGQQTVIRNRCGWAGTYLKKAGLLTYPQRAHLQITTRGLEALKERPEHINVRYLKDISEEFVEFSASRSKARQGNDSEVVQIESGDDAIDPSERLQLAYKEIHDSLTTEVLDTVCDSSWQFFEKLVVDLMRAMGYGSALGGSAKPTQYTNDDGIDGIISEDPLGLDKIYLQAKKWKNNIQRPEIDKFIGALTRKGATKGVFITTSEFSSGALEAASGLSMNIVLINGEQLAELMVQYGLGVNTKEVYRIKSLDTDYFNED